MSCCPNLDSEDFLILSAWHLVASSYTKLVNAQLPRLHQHEHVTDAPENNRVPSMGRWGIATAPACRDQVCERSVSLAVLSASWSVWSSLFVLLWACKPARRATQNKHQNIDFIEERTSPWVKQKSSCACVFMCIRVCVWTKETFSVTSPTLSLLFLFLCEYQWMAFFFYLRSLTYQQTKNKNFQKAHTFQSMLNLWANHPLCTQIRSGVFSTHTCKH